MPEAKPEQGRGPHNFPERDRTHRGSLAGVVFSDARLKYINVMASAFDEGEASTSAREA